MAFAAEAIRQAIIERLEGGTGPVTVDAGTFKFGVFEGQPDAAKQSKAMQADVAAHRFDVKFSPLRNSEASTVGTNTARRIVEVDVTIPVWTHVKTTAQETERKAILAAIESDCEDAIQVLGYPSSLSATAASEATSIVSGLMLGPGAVSMPTFETLEADWAKQLIKSQIVGTLIVTVTALIVATGGGGSGNGFLWFFFGL